MFQQDNGGLCPAEGTNPYNSSVIPTVDPSLSYGYQGCDYADRLTPLVPCKNNCRGVAGVTIVAGGAALVAATTLAATSFSPVLSLIIGEINIININTG